MKTLIVTCVSYTSPETILVVERNIAKSLLARIDGAHTCALMLLCVCTTPLGFPVVPLVYIINAGSSPS